MSVTKNSNQNQLHQVEMQLCHVYFHRTSQYHMVNCACVLHHFMKLKDIACCIREDPCIHYWNYFSTSKGHVTRIISKVNSILTHCNMAYESVLSLSTCLRLRRRMLQSYQKSSKKHISTSNF